MNTVLWFLCTAVCSPWLFLRARLRSRTEPQKILIIQWAKLGDMVCTTPMFRAVKESLPDATVHLLCRPGSAVVVERNRFVDRVIPWSGRRSRLVRMLMRERYDAVVTCLPGAFWSMVGLWCGARHRINTPSEQHGHIVRWSRAFNTENIPYCIGTSVVGHYMALLRPLGVRPLPYRLEFFPSPEDRSSADRWMHERGLTERSFVLFNVSAGNAVKEWPAEKFAELADRVAETHGLSVVVSTLDQERMRGILCLCRHPERIIDASSLSLGQVACLCAKTAAFASVDTGPMFIAHAMGAPVAVIVGGSDIREQIPPAGERVVHVLPPPGCTPWMHVSRSPRTATGEQLRCVRDTPVEAVEAALGSLLCD